MTALVVPDKLAWCGWPEGEAELADCTLTKKATDAQRYELLERMAKGANGSKRANRARWALAEAERLGQMRIEVGR